MQLNPLSANPSLTRSNGAPGGKPVHDGSLAGPGDVLVVGNHSGPAEGLVIPRWLPSSGQSESTPLEPPVHFPPLGSLVAGVRPQDVQGIPITYVLGQNGKPARIIVGDPIPLKK